MRGPSPRALPPVRGQRRPRAPGGSAPLAGSGRSGGGAPGLPRAAVTLRGRRERGRGRAHPGTAGPGYRDAAGGCARAGMEAAPRGGRIGRRLREASALSAARARRALGDGNGSGGGGGRALPRPGAGRRQRSPALAPPLLTEILI